MSESLLTAATRMTPLPAVGALTSPSNRVTLAAARLRQPQASVPSPCVGVCKMDDVAGWCKGCFRTLDELTGWSRATDATKLAVWTRVEQRQR